MVGSDRSNGSRVVWRHRSLTNELVPCCPPSHRLLQIPIKDNAEANAKAMAKVRADKLREVKAGHDGTWVGDVCFTFMGGPSRKRCRSLIRG